MGDIIKLIQGGNLALISSWLRQNRNWNQMKLGENSDTILHISVKNQNQDLTRYILASSDTPPNTQNSYGETPLHLACFYGNLDIFRALLEYGANPEIKENREGAYPIHRTVEGEHENILDEFIRHGFSLKLLNNERESPLHLAVDLGLENFVKKLILNGSDIEVEDSNGDRAVHKACRANHPKILELLIANGAIIDPRNHRDETPLTIAIRHIRIESIQKIIEAGARVRDIDLRLAREVGRPSFWQFISKIYKEQTHHSPNIQAEEEKSPEDPKPVKKSNSVGEVETLDTISSLKKRISELETKIASLTSNKKIEGIIDSSEIKVLEVIGRGQYGEVSKGIWRSTEIALKKFSLADTAEFLTELEVLKNIRHPNIVLFMGACMNPPIIMTEYISQGSLSHLLHETHEPLSLSQLVGMAVDIARGLLFLHTCKPPIVHRDLKPGNCLVDSHCRVKICDFGLARVKENTIRDSGAYGTYPYVAPEIITEHKYSLKSDIFAFGMLLWELLNRRRPFNDLQPIQIMYQIAHLNKRPEMSQNTQLTGLIEKCWDQDPINRPTIQEILQEIQEFYCIIR
ncbi:unnamed protein product [Blepharisma stoltei]|uniref:Protein kinase domain-containing protein n=1 Tax=Blepharisma stoltei TaxID=1481888 RepID=A0AAU9J032_9CILI|nr:unnamed protein product [Blepharisma stoltei]